MFKVDVFVCYSHFLRDQDAYEFSATPDQLTTLAMTGMRGANDDKIVEVKPMFHEWASVLPGMICVARKNKTQVFRQYQVCAHRFQV